MKRTTLAGGIAGLLALAYFAHPIYDMLRIAAVRVEDQIRQKFSAPILAVSYDDVVKLNSEAVLEIDDYVRRLRENVAPEVTALDYTSLAAYVDSQKALGKLLRSGLHFPAPLTISSGDFSAVQLSAIGEDELATYTLLAVPAFPGVRSVGTLILPKKHAARMPLIIAAHGRGGLPEKPAAGKIPVMQYNNRDLARGAIERGWAVYEPIFVFYGKDQPENIRDVLTVRAQEAGTTLPAIEIAKTTRALDYLCTRADIDPTRIAMAGISYGGFNTLYTTALDARIKVAVVAAYFNDRAAVLDRTEPNGFLDWRFPGSLGALRDPNIVALVCPRPLQIQAGKQDQLFPIEGARRAAPEGQAFYTRLGIPARFEFHEFLGRHDFDGEAAWNFIARHWEDESD